MRSALSISLPDEMLVRLKKEAGDVPVSRFVERALEAYLDGRGALDDPATVQAKREFLEAQEASPDGKVDVRIEGGSTRPGRNLMEDMRAETGLTDDEAVKEFQRGRVR